MQSIAATLALLGLLALPVPARAQDEPLDVLLFTRGMDLGTDVEAHVVQLYRVPLGIALRPMSSERWGARLTFPVSFSAVRVDALTDISQVIRSLRVAAIVPGVELQIPVAQTLRLRPFAEAGIGGGSAGGGVEVLYGAGVRARFEPQIRYAHLTFGGSAMRRKPADDDRRYEAHSTFEGAIDVQVPLGVSIGERQTRGGVYAIGRRFAGLVLRTDTGALVALERQLEFGISFATSPELRVWKVKLPWLAAGYQFGETISGVRVYLSFPF